MYAGERDMYTVTQRARMRLKAHVTGLVNQIRGLEYPDRCDVSAANLYTIEFFTSTNSQAVAEVGIYEGATSMLLAQHMGGRGTLYLFDFEERVRSVLDQLYAQGYHNVIGYGNSHKTHDSYNWQLMRFLEQHPEPLFDYVFLDGAHTWGIDALAFCLIDRLLKVGGYVDFDDYAWSIGRSDTMNPRVFPQVHRMYTPEQIEAPHVKLVVDLLVRRDPRYTEVVKDKIYQKVG